MTSEGHFNRLTDCCVCWQTLRSPGKTYGCRPAPHLLCDSCASTGRYDLGCPHCQPETCREPASSRAPQQKPLPPGRTFVAHDDLDGFLRQPHTADADFVRGLEDGISVVNKCEQRTCRENGIEKVQHFGMGNHDIVAAEDRFLCYCQMDESMALTKLLVKNCVLKITGLEAFSNGRRKPINKTINAAEQVLVLEMPGDYFKLVVEAAPATQQDLPSRHLGAIAGTVVEAAPTTQQDLPSWRLGARAGTRDPLARSALPRAGWFS